MAETKRCTLCGQIKPRDHFRFKNKALRLRHDICRDCHVASLARCKAKRENQPPTLPDEKQCTRCVLVKPIEEFPWASKRLTQKQAQCYDCRRPNLLENRARAKTRRQAKRAVEIAKRRAATEKRCSKCKLVKPIDRYRPRAASLDGYESQCADCRKATGRASYQRHREARIAAVKSWYNRNQEDRREYNRRYREENADYYISYNSIWARNNLDKGRARRTKRRAALLRAMPWWVEQDALLAVYTAAVAHSLEVDHIVPLQSKVVCGLHVPWNLQLLTRAENTAKRNYHWPDMP